MTKYFCLYNAHFCPSFSCIYFWLLENVKSSLNFTFYWLPFQRRKIDVFLHYYGSNGPVTNLQTRFRLISPNSDRTSICHTRVKRQSMRLRAFLYNPDLEVVIVRAPCIIQIYFRIIRRRVISSYLQQQNAGCVCGSLFLFSVCHIITEEYTSSERTHIL